MFQTYTAVDGLEVDAVKLTEENVGELEKLTHSLRVEEIDPFDSSKRYVALNVPTLNGMKRCSEGDYIVRWGDDEYIYVRNGAEFERFWEKV